MEPNNLIQQKLLEDSINQEDKQTLSLRAQRYLKVKPHGIVPLYININLESVKSACLSNLLSKSGSVKFERSSKVK
ncbi:unnamed protein product, partial [marine sediment metagenome]